MKLENRKALVTGAAKGIGYSTASRLLRDGAVVTLWDVDEEGLDAAKAELSNSIPGSAGRIFTAVCDVSDQGAVQARAEQAEEDMGGVDILINNAGFMAPGFFLEQPLDSWKKTVDINLTSILFTSHAFLPGMYRRGFGHVVNISSAAGLVGVPGLSAYCASKWGVFGLTESLRHESRIRSGGKVKFSSVHPMFLRTGMFEGASLKGLGSIIFPRVANHDVIAKAIVEGALKRGRRVVKRPRSLRLVLLLRGLLPDAIFNGMSRIMNVHTSMNRYKGA